MATEYPPLSKIHVVGYSANDKNYPILNQLLDPRVAGYKVPEDFSTCPDKRYPNHIFTGAQPISGDQRVRHTWEILPSPWVPFTRYDDDLGPVQGRRRSVKNEGQQASLTSSTKISYEGREGSSLVLIESEETWSIKTDDDGNSLFPVKVRDFYDPSRGAVEERRQLFVPTGEEVGTLENVDGIITQTSYDVYNEYLSYKIVQTYAVDGPQLVGQATGNDGQLVTVTTQRKASKDYEPPTPTALRTVEVSREDAESVVERVVDTPELFNEISVSSEIPVAIPERYLVTKPITTTSVVSVITGEEGEMDVSASGNTISQQKQKIDVHKKRTITRTQSLSSFGTLSGTDYDESLDVQIPFDEYITTSVPAASTEYAYEADPLGGGKYLVKRYSKSSIAANLSRSYFSMPSRTTITGVPPVLKKFDIKFNKSTSSGSYSNSGNGDGDGDSGNLGVSGTGRADSSVSFDPSYEIELEEINTTNIPSMSCFFFLGDPVTVSSIIAKTKTVLGLTKNLYEWPIFKPKSHIITIVTNRKTVNAQRDFNSQTSWGLTNYSRSYNTGIGEGTDVQTKTTFLTLPLCLHEKIEGKLEETANLKLDVSVNITGRVNVSLPEKHIDEEVKATSNYNLSATNPPNVPRKDYYMVDYKVEPYKFGFYKVYVEVVDASMFA